MLEEVLELIIDHRGKTATKLGGQWQNHGIPVISANNLRNGQFVDMDSVKHIGEILFEKWMPLELKPGDVLLVSEGATFGEVLYLKDNLKVALGQRLFALRCNERYVGRYLYYYLKSKFGQNELNSKTTGTSVLGIRQSELRRIKVPLVNMDEQQQISTILGSIDDKISLNLKMNKTLEAIGQAIFKNWFIDFEFPNEDGKPYKSSSGEMCNSELGLIPKSWTVGKLKDYVSVVKGCSYRSDDLQESQIALVTLKSINRGGGFNQSGYKEYVGEYADDQILRDGEVVVAQTDLTQKAEVIGRPAIVNSLGKYSTLVASLDLQVVRTKTDFSKNYIYYLLLSENFHNHALSYTNGTTVLHLNKNAIPEFTSIIPAKEILDRFDNIVEYVLKKIHLNEAEIQTLSNIRDSFLPKLMSGKIKVPVGI